MMASPTCILPRWPTYSREKVQDDDSQVCRSVGATQKPDFISNWDVQILLSKFVCISFQPLLNFYKPCLHVFVDFQKSGDQILRSRILCQT